MMILEDAAIQQKLYKDDKKYNLFANSNTAPPEYDFKKMRMERVLA